MIKKGCYIKNEVCSKCNWYQKLESIGGIMLNRDICPDCGSELKTVVGRFLIEKTKTFFGMSTQSKRVGFERKAP